MKIPIFLRIYPAFPWGGKKTLETSFGSAEICSDTCLKLESAHSLSSETLKTFIVSSLVPLAVSISIVYHGKELVEPIKSEDHPQVLQVAWEAPPGPLEKTEIKPLGSSVSERLKRKRN